MVICALTLTFEGPYPSVWVYEYNEKELKNKQVINFKRTLTTLLPCYVLVFYLVVAPCCYYCCCYFQLLLLLMLLWCPDWL